MFCTTNDFIIIIIITIPKQIVVKCLFFEKFKFSGFFISIFFEFVLISKWKTVVYLFYFYKKKAPKLCPEIGHITFYDMKLFDLRFMLSNNCMVVMGYQWHNLNSIFRTMFGFMVHIKKTQIFIGYLQLFFLRPSTAPFRWWNPERILSTSYFFHAVHWIRGKNAHRKLIFHWLLSRFTGLIYFQSNRTNKLVKLKGTGYYSHWCRSFTAVLPNSNTMPMSIFVHWKKAMKTGAF